MSPNKPHVLFSSLCVGKHKVWTVYAQLHVTFPDPTCHDGEYATAPSLLVPKCCQRLSHLPLVEEQPQTTEPWEAPFSLLFNMVSDRYRRRFSTRNRLCEAFLTCPASFNVVLSTNPIDHTLSWLDGEESIRVKVRRTFEHFS